jgi:hypothetical protein
LKRLRSSSPQAHHHGFSCGYQGYYHTCQS